MSATQTTIPSDAVSRRGGDGDHKWSRLLLALAVVLILHLPILLLNRMREEPAKPVQQSRLAAVTSQDDATTPGEKLLWRWILLTEPSQWYYPTEGGFSGFNRREPAPLPSLPGYTLERHPLPESLFSPTRLTAEIAPPNDQEFLALKPYLPAPEEVTTTVPAAGPAWRRHGGGLLASPPALDDSVKEVLAQKSTRDALARVLLPTTLEVQFRTDLESPRVLLRRSCGVPKLDQAALKALRLYLWSPETARRISPSREALLLDVSWIY